MDKINTTANKTSPVRFIKCNTTRSEQIPHSKNNHDLIFFLKPYNTGYDSPAIPSDATMPYNVADTPPFPVVSSKIVNERSPVTNPYIAISFTVSTYKNKEEKRIVHKINDTISLVDALRSTHLLPTI